MSSSKIDLVAKTIEEVRIDAARGDKGDEVDLCNVLLKVIKEWETKGREWVFKHYWLANPDPEISNWEHNDKEDSCG